MSFRICMFLNWSVAVFGLLSLFAPAAWGMPLWPLPAVSCAAIRAPATDAISADATKTVFGPMCFMNPHWKCDASVANPAGLTRGLGPGHSSQAKSLRTVAPVEPGGLRLFERKHRCQVRDAQQLQDARSHFDERQRADLRLMAETCGV